MHICAIIYNLWCLVYNNKKTQKLRVWIFLFVLEHKYIYVDKKGWIRIRINSVWKKGQIQIQIYSVWKKGKTNIFGLKKRANRNINIFGLKKGQIRI